MRYELISGGKLIKSFAGLTDAIAYADEYSETSEYAVSIFEVLQEPLESGLISEESRMIMVCLPKGD